MQLGWRENDVSAPGTDAEGQNGQGFFWFSFLASEAQRVVDVLRQCLSVIT